MNRLLVLCLPLVLAACAGTPDVRYYLLPPAPSTPATASESAASVEVRLAGYLASPSIAYRQGPVQVSLAQFHQWAEAPQPMLRRALAERLSTRTGRAWLTQGNSTAPRVIVDVSEFGGSDDGTARVGGQYRFVASDGKAQASWPFDIRVPQQGDGYAALAKALGEGVDRLAGEIAARPLPR
ncbi:PqiC family protein [Crenobacter intestini]|uniref:Membrane integrity-associated transporter subunit PqiC n=1 Tax=Crenobacter intestini TaxID=2563443 RepID=A0A4T0UX96_9NEIS|nr:ABC-type transport auxiliary lipoprotein family protein [Crenobacter intestini]TIC83752.1 membrane integrity-associated transporter subunit PqiC [Crenobacter intestini]